MNIDEIRARAEKASAGPWRNHDHNSMAKVGENPADWIGYAWVGHGGYPNGNFDAKIADLDARTDGSEKWREQKQHDAAFIAHARQDIPALIARVDELEAALRPFAKEALQKEPTFMRHELNNALEVLEGRAAGPVVDEPILSAIHRQNNALAMKAPAKSEYKQEFDGG